MLVTSLRGDPKISSISAARQIASGVASRIQQTGDELSFPETDIAALDQYGLLHAPFPMEVGGEGLALGAAACDKLLHVLRALGAGSLPLGRLFEGHVNAVALIGLYGTHEQLAALACRRASSALLAVWNTDDPSAPLRLISDGNGWRLMGRKVLCSGAGFIERPLVTARDESGRILMVMPYLRRGERADLSKWTPTGMQASATGSVDLTNLVVTNAELVGDEEDYHRQPAFSGGAWRFAAVHLGAMEALLDLCREHHLSTRRGAEPHQAARLAQGMTALETARLWVERAAFLAEVRNENAQATVAYVNLARLAVERAALDLIELVQRSIGLASFLRPHPVERITRDLATYLRQPAPDRALVAAAEWVLDCEQTIADLWS